MITITYKGTGADIRKSILAFYNVLGDERFSSHYELNVDLFQLRGSKKYEISLTVYDPSFTISLLGDSVLPEVEMHVVHDNGLHVYEAVKDTGAIKWHTCYPRKSERIKLQEATYFNDGEMATAPSVAEDAKKEELDDYEDIKDWEKRNSYY